MIYLLEELLKLDDSVSFNNYIKSQFEELLNYEMKNISEIYKISKTTITFVEIDSKMVINGIIITNCKNFLFDEKIFFIEFFTSNDNNIKDKLLSMSLDYIKSSPDYNNEMIISLLIDNELNKDILKKHNFNISDNIISCFFLND